MQHKTGSKIVRLRARESKEGIGDCWSKYVWLFRWPDDARVKPSGNEKHAEMGNLTDMHMHENNSPGAEFWPINLISYKRESSGATEHPGRPVDSRNPFECCRAASRISPAKLLKR